MNYSGSVITLNDAKFDDTVERLGKIEQLEVFQLDRPTCRAVAVIEAPTTQGEADVFDIVRRTDGVLDVSLINHYFSDEAAK